MRIALFLIEKLSDFVCNFIAYAVKLIKWDGKFYISTVRSKKAYVLELVLHIIKVFFSSYKWIYCPAL